jgi:hypothetical protein
MLDAHDCDSTDLADNGKQVQFKNANGGSNLGDDGAIIKLNVAAPSKDVGTVVLKATGQNGGSGCGAITTIINLLGVIKERDRASWAARSLVRWRRVQLQRIPECPRLLHRLGAQWTASN